MGIDGRLGNAIGGDRARPGELRKIGGGVSHFEAGIFSWENGFGGRKIGGCQAMAPARLAGMSGQ